MKGYTKSRKKKLRELAGIANERELDKEMEKLCQHFENWRNEKISCFELCELIHKFHQGPSREIWKIYNRGRSCRKCLTLDIQYESYRLCQD